MKPKKQILIAGATGYIGRKLIQELEKRDYSINCLTRNTGALNSVGPGTKVFEGDALVRSSMWRAFQDVHTAFFLIHMLHERDDFEAKEIEAAENFASMARSAGVKRIIYLGALGNSSDTLSPHLQSRQDVGHALRKSHIPTIELRASIVIGKGSTSFELIADLTEKLPLMITPRWVSTPAQPISIRNLLDYLVQAVEIPILYDEIIEIGGSDCMSYGELMREYARQRGLKRHMIPVPVLTPRLSSHWLNLVTNIDPILGRKLIEGLRNPTIVEDSRADRIFSVRTDGIRQAMAEALADESKPEIYAEGLAHVYAA